MSPERIHSNTIKRLSIIAIIAAAATSIPNVARPQEMSFLFFGDFMQHDPQINAAKISAQRFEYDDYFKFIKGLVESVDVAVANLEVTLGGQPYSGYPQFSAPDEYAHSIQRAGFDILTTANNHSNDRRSYGLERTLTVLDSLGLTHLGTYRDSTERNHNYPLIINKSGIKVALLNYTYGTNGIKTSPPNVVNMISEKSMLADIHKAQKAQPDKIIAIMHWGAEYRSFPDAYQQKWGEWLLNNGVDIVIGGHPHWIQPMEYRNDSLGNEKLVVWSLGNAVSNQRRRHTDGGASIQFTLARSKDGQVGIEQIGYHLHWVWVYTDEDRTHYQLLPVQMLETVAKLMPASHKEQCERFIRDERTLYQNHNLSVPEFIYNEHDKTYFLLDPFTIPRILSF